MPTAASAFESSPPHPDKTKSLLTSKVFGHNNRVTKGKSFSDYLLHRSKQYFQQGKIGMYRVADRLSRGIKECFGDISVREIDADKVRDFDGLACNEKRK